jgi:outer membrane receptor protein involved in Fe transport
MKRRAGSVLLNSTAILLAGGVGMMSAATPAAGADEIIVTAQKRSENILDVPIAITALQGDDVDRFGATDFRDYARLSPSVSFRNEGPNYNKIVIRGVSASGGNAPTTGVYFDEIPIETRIGNLDVSTFDLERVEVLRGPQGTLYGGSSMGGTVKFITKKPDPNEFDARLKAGVGAIEGGDELYNLAGMVNLPLIEDKLALRAMGSIRHDGGWVDRQSPMLLFDPEDPASYVADPNALRQKNVNDLDVYTTRVTAAYTPTENLTLTPSYYRQHTAAGARFDFDSPPGDYGDEVQLRLTDESLRDVTSLYSLTTQYGVGGFDFISSTSYFDRTLSRSEDASLGLYRLFNVVGYPADSVLTYEIPYMNSEQMFTQEVRVSTPQAKRIRATVGAFYQHDRYHVETSITDPHHYAEDLLLVGIVQDRIRKQVAVFGEAYFDILENLTLTAGLRWYDSSFTFDHSLEGPFGTESGGLEVSPQETAKSSGTNPKAALSYEPSENTLVYASAAKGFRVGGTNAVLILGDECDAGLAAIGLTEAPTKYDSDGLWSYEVGAKASTADGRLSAAAAVYQIDWSDLQQDVVLGEGCGANFTANVGNARIRGAEIELTASPLDGLSLRAAGSYNDAEITRAAPGTNAALGAPLLDTPKWTLGVTGEYARPVRNGVDAIVGVTYQYSSEIFGAYDFSDTDFRRPGYGIADVRLGLEGESWSLTASVTNVFDKQTPLVYPGTESFPLPGVSRVLPVRPRTFGVQFDQSF